VSEYKRVEIQAVASLNGYNIF